MHAGCVLCALRRPDEAKEAFKNAICANEHHIEVGSCKNTYEFICS